jgi:hypothetical protein
MKEITLSFTPDELRELAKQLYLAGYFLLSIDYDNQAMVDDINTRVCATGFAEAPETGAFRHGGPMETIFMISPDVYEECDPLVDQYNDDAMQHHLPYALADRDFFEQYGTLEPEIVLRDPVMLAALEGLQAKYIREVGTYGITHLRLEEKG